MRNNKGVSLVTLVITIVVMIIIFSITINSSINSIKETNSTKIDNEIKTLKEAVNDRIANYERNATLYPFVGEKIGDDIFNHIRSIETMTSDEKKTAIEDIAEVYSTKTLDYYRLVGKNEAEKLGIEGIDMEHYYVVDYYTGNVYGPINIELVTSR